MGIFECPACMKHVTMDYSNGMKGETCSRKCRLNNGCTTHGKSGTPIYVCWNNIRIRCDKSTCSAYKHYGAKGITYPEKWKTFEGFYEDMGDSYKEGLSLDRKDSSLNYSKENCAWIPIEINRIKDRIKTVVQLTLKGEYVDSFCSVSAAAKATGICITSIAKVARGERKKASGFLWEYR